MGVVRDLPPEYARNYYHTWNEVEPPMPQRPPPVQENRISGQSADQVCPCRRQRSRKLRWSARSTRNCRRRAPEGAGWPPVIPMARRSARSYYIQARSMTRIASSAQRRPGYAVVTLVHEEPAQWCRHRHVLQLPTTRVNPVASTRCLGRSLDSLQFCLHQFYHRAVLSMPGSIEDERPGCGWLVPLCSAHGRRRDWRATQQYICRLSQVRAVD